ncbi:hypothetical protein LTR36_003277 [Oleoguttula mirabilis]|uniref:Endosomal/vacuolar adapter protein YPT35 n=1 Tax=Oleoguttula mirabilis TaxID=1507867 RepID=A0AAV9JX31_9PEZI|nr:hypothetical protein LTR36_003277 [Oleoguttula mirabilis]
MEETPPGHAEPRDILPATASTDDDDELEHHMQGDATPTAASGTDHLLAEPNNQVTDAPPFWSRHGRSVSTVSYHSITQTNRRPILLEDHSEEDHTSTQSCWAQSVTIDDYVILTGPTGIGAYIVWHCTVRTLNGGDLEIRKRYSEFDQLREDLIKSFPQAAQMIPQLPRKSVVSRFRPKFLEQRKAGLSHFLNCILLNPEFAASPVLKGFIFS